MGLVSCAKFILSYNLFYFFYLRYLFAFYLSSGFLYQMSPSFTVCGGKGRAIETPPLGGGGGVKTKKNFLELIGETAKVKKVFKK